MPPRYAYWTILIDQKPTAFRAKDREELLPTFAQLQRKNSDVVMKWFARGRLWDSPEQAQWAQRNMPPVNERRGRDWRPGGQHKDPRARFDKPKSRFAKAPAARHDPDERKPLKPEGEWKPHEGKSDQRPGPNAQGPETKRPWKPRPQGERRPWKPKGEWEPREGRSDQGPTPNAQRPETKRPWTPRPEGERRPWKPKGEFVKPGTRSPKPEAWRRHGPKGPKKRG